MSKDTKNNESEKDVRSIADINPNERKNSVIDTLPPPLPQDKSNNESNKKQINLEKEKHNLLFGIRRSVRYHNRRILFYDRLHKITNSLSLLSGSATIIAVLKPMGNFWITSFAFLVTIFSALDLIISPDKASRIHNELSIKFFNLEKAIITSKDITEEILANFTAMRLDVEMNEPPILKILDSICHNELLRAMGYGENHFVKIKWYQRVFCHFFDLYEQTIKAA